VTCRVEILNLNSGIGEISIWVSNFYPASQPAIRRRALHVRATKRRGLVMELPPMLWFSAHGVAQKFMQSYTGKGDGIWISLRGRRKPEAKTPAKVQQTDLVMR
jgi:hypothetical protein